MATSDSRHCCGARGRRSAISAFTLLYREEGLKPRERKVSVSRACHSRR